MFLVNKQVGETPLEAMEQFRRENIPMTYAGRLDPMAEGLLIVLTGDECKEKEKYTALDKVYETEIVLGYATDTYDVLGLVQSGGGNIGGLINDDFLAKFVGTFKQEYPPYSSKTVAGKALFQHAREGTLDKVYETEIVLGYATDTYDVLGLVQSECGNVDGPINDDFLAKFVGTFKQEYPPYSSKTVAGKALFQHAREGTLDTIEIPVNEVTIFSIEKIGEREMSTSELLADICERISKVKGDFRQKEILTKWGEVLAGENKCKIIKIRVHCSSGTYIRSLAERMGKELGCGAFALSIKRTRVGEFILPE